MLSKHKKLSSANKWWQGVDLLQQVRQHDPGRQAPRLPERPGTVRISELELQ